MSQSDDQRPARPTSFVVGADLSAFSLEELTDLASLLRTEIERIDATYAAKAASRNAADQVFGRPR
jgi:uncharacterized small protein (DUF1192 family)